MHCKNGVLNISVVLTIYWLFIGNPVGVFANKGKGGSNNNKVVSNPKKGNNKANPTLAPATPKMLFAIVKTTRAPQWLKDDKSRAGKINMRPLEGTPHTILRKRMKWVEGDIACQIKLGTQMAILDTQEKAEKLVKALMDISVWNNTKPDFMHAIEKYEYGLNRRYWIGLSDLPALEGGWEWKSNDDNVTERLFLNYTFWHPGQPDHLVIESVRVNKTNVFLKRRKPMEHCGALWNPTFYRSELHSFNDEPCNKRYYVICDNPASGPPKVTPAPKE